MSQQIKITESELAEIKMLQGKFQETIIKLGNLGAEEIEVDRLVTEYTEKKKKYKDEWINLQKLEKGILDKIVQKYGEGNLNINDGTFTSTIPPAS